MKGFYIFEEKFVKGTVDCLEIGYIDHTFTHQIDSGTLSEEVKMHALVSKGRKAKCSPEDTYDFETGALIALMKMCGLEKSAKAYAEIFDDTAYGDALIERDKLKEEIKRLKEKNAELLGANGALNYIKSCNESTIESLENTRDLLINKNNELISDKDKSWKNYQRKIQKKQDRINELEAQITASEDDKQKNIEYYEKEIKKLRGFLELYEKENKELKKNIDELFKSEQHSKSELGRLYFEKHRLEEKVEKLKLDCEKLQHGYIDTDMIFCGGRGNGKQYTLLVDLFKKIDQKKVDAAYKEAYGSRVIWCSSQPSTRDMLASLLESSKYAIPTEFTFKIDQVKPPTKREHKWERILEIHKKSNVVIEVEKEDVSTFLHELEDKIPEIRWVSRQKIFEAKGTIKDIYGALKTCDRIYFRLRKENELSYSSDPDIYQYKDLEHISYLPPMRWDLFKEGRIAVKVNYNNYKEFYEACEKELGKKPMTVYSEDYTVSICKKDGLFEVFTLEHQKKTGKKIVDWEDVR